VRGAVSLAREARVWAGGGLLLGVDEAGRGPLAGPVLAEDAKTTGKAPAEAKFSTVSKDEMFSSKLKGLNVYNQKDESVGQITDVAIKNNQIDALILSVGGFLGMGERYVAVSPSSVNIRHDSKNDKWLASMNTTKEALKAAPEFKYPK